MSCAERTAATDPPHTQQRHTRVFKVPKVLKVSKDPKVFKVFKVPKDLKVPKVSKVFKDFWDFRDFKVFRDFKDLKKDLAAGAGVEGEVVGGNRPGYPLAKRLIIGLPAFGCELFRRVVEDCEDS